MKNNTIGKRIAEARINRNITQEHLEELSGLSVSTISRIETGKYMPTIENLLKLSEILDVGLDYFLYDLLPHNKDIQSPAIQDAISIMNQMGERQTENIPGLSSGLNIITIRQFSCFCPRKAFF
jgi:transcriptional regulator with XRE-family HTH domain